MSNKWLVLKFGGSSVRGGDEWRAIVARVEERRAEGFRLLLVCSAVQGITDQLQEIARSPAEQSLQDRVIDSHLRLSHELGIDASRWIDKAGGRIARLRAEIQSNASPAKSAELLAIGEWLSTRIGWQFLNQTMEAEWVDARGLLQVEADTKRSEQRQWLAADCTPGFDASMRTGLNACAPVVVTQGFIAGMPGGGTALLGRGGSDTSAVLLGGRIGAERVEIWTDVPGMFSCDPRQIPEARLLRRLDYAETLEMAASGAGVMHARSIRAAAATATPLWIRDSGRPGIGGTRIDNLSALPEGAKAVVCQPEMAVLLLQNVDPRQQVGFLAWVFAAVAERGISIDLVATSETTTTIAVNRAANHLEIKDLEALADDLRVRCKVDLFADCVTVNVVGRGVRRSLASLNGVFQQFDAKPLHMVSQSANDLCLSMLVNRGDEAELMRAAHRALIPDGEDETVFGPSWLELQAQDKGDVAAGGLA